MAHQSEVGIDERRLAWIDTETTGLCPFTCGSRLLEIACRITDSRGNLVDDGGYRAVVRYTPTEALELRAAADDVVKAMHSRTGLWGRLPFGTPREQVESQLLDYIKRFAPKRRQARLAGNSVALDRKFLEAELPAVEQWLHYRVVDCSSTRFVLEALGHHGTPLEGVDPEHTAWDDIMGSIAEYRWQLAELSGGLE
ncbi:oligoribonuclease [Pseudoclavibacter sp. CFCC 13796]|uniref:oligoribonuclease n=1 Tax=Pseudoclavibacter sp. CFCC 13796 TaxID=2615179 RepID=UPI001301001A|nr:oligoribonuclease [Pseudoclavibacter sp. CFCC 13796]KAB1661590.1 oligoribonuclease [Pseudoclavibacter sp. CFCC 13796]